MRNSRSRSPIHKYALPLDRRTVTKARFYQSFHFSIAEAEILVRRGYRSRHKGSAAVTKAGNYLTHVQRREGGGNFTVHRWWKRLRFSFGMLFAWRKTWRASVNIYLPAGPNLRPLFIYFTPLYIIYLQNCLIICSFTNLSYNDLWWNGYFNSEATNDCQKYTLQRVMKAFRIILASILQPFPSDEISSDESLGQSNQICCMVIGDSRDSHSETGCFINMCWARMGLRAV